MNVLGLETSCDETGLAIYNSEQGLLGDVLYSQIALHALYGGVVPELASRDHIKKLVPLFDELLQKTGLQKTDINAIAYTKGPGLIGALMTGALFGRSLAYALDVPAIGVHHMEGHLLAVNIDQKVPFPFLTLLVSGGHTQLVVARGVGDYTVLGQSIDDAAGECFDKAAKMLDLPYPGGAHIAKLAQTGQAVYELPRPMLAGKFAQSLDFSFSGMKTAVHNLIKNELTDLAGQSSDEILTIKQKIKSDIAKSFEIAMIDVLVKKCLLALKQTKLKRLVIAGGVSANAHLRHTLDIELPKIGASVHYAPPNLCTDNGAMIAYAGFCRLQAGLSDDLAVACLPRWGMADLPKVGLGYGQ